jgi:hypothetical protein
MTSRPRVDLLSVRGGRGQGTAGGGDQVASDEHITVGQVAQLRIHGDDVPAPDE